MWDFELSICICSWNAKDDLRLCLRSLREVSEEVSFETIVVENASSDRSGEMVQTEFPEVRLLQQQKNLGFTGGNNLAIAQRCGRHVLMLNSDTIVHPGALKELMRYLNEHPGAGILGPKLLNPDGSLQYSARRFPNPIAALFRSTLLGRLFPNNPFLRKYLMLDWDHAEARKVDWVSGAAMLIRDKTLEKVGLLDPEFFMFCEDTDYCWRAGEHGLSVEYVPSAVITHAIGRSANKAVNRMIIRFHRSMFRFYLKHQIKEVPVLARPLHLIMAVTGLSTRASLFILKNWFDMVRRLLPLK